MAQKDIAEKHLEEYKDVFADIVNGLLFHGTEIVTEKELEHLPLHSMYKAEDGKLHEMERDSLMEWRQREVCIAVIGGENQTSSDPDMALRLIGYDGQSYRSQLLKAPNIGADAKRYPVITLVLYFGDKPWKGPKSLHERLDIPDMLKPYVNNYQINLFEISFLTDEQITLFKSDFKMIADYFVQKRKKQKPSPVTQNITHSDEFYKLLYTITGDDNFKEILSVEKERRPQNMCEMLDRIRQEGVAIGREQGLQQALSTSLTAMVTLLKGIPLDEVCERIRTSETAYQNVSIQDIKPIYERINA